jgi:hypothetical protein
MTLSIDCTCGAHLEIDGKFAGQSIQCPDCQQPLQVPTAAVQAVHTSGFALASFILALVGAFTVVGTVAAIILGVLGLRAIGKNPSRLTGNGYALAGIVLGVLFTALGLFAYARVEVFGLDRLMRERQWAGKLEFGDSTEVATQSGFSLPRPSRNWGKLLDQSDGVFVQDRSMDSVILVDVRDDAHAIAFLFDKAPDVADKLETDRELALERFLNSKLVRLLARGRGKPAVSAPKVISTTKAANGGRESQEVVFDIHLGKHERTFIMRVIPIQPSLYVVAAGARKNRFAGMETELRQIVANFKVNERREP